MNKLMVLSGLMLGGLLLMTGQSEAASSRGGAKAMHSTGFSAAISTVSVSPAALYQVVLPTGTAGTDYVALYDASTAAGLSATTYTASSYRGRIYVSSATQNTVVTFDPPMQFNSGLIAINSGATIQATLVYERGRPTGN